MTIEQFASNHRLTIKRDSCGEAIIAGRPRNAVRNEDRNHIYEHSDDTLGICLILDSTGKWNNRRKDALAAGFILGQNGKTEGTMLFSPDDPKQSRLAIKLVGAREKRILTPEEAVVMNARMARMRAAHLQQ